MTEEMVSFSVRFTLTLLASIPIPSISEVIPPSGPAGTRVVLLGGNFLNTPNLRVAFAQSVIVPTFHESGW